MNAALINRFINLLKKAGHPVIYGDPETGQSIVVMNLDEYEKLLDLKPEGQSAQPEPYDPILNNQSKENFPSKNTRREHRPEEMFEAVLENSVEEPIVEPVVEPEPVKPNPSADANQNLTSDRSAVKINREINSQPNNQRQASSGQHRPNQSAKKSVNQSPVQSANEPDADQIPSTGLDDEERFYLEPLE